MSSHLYAGLDLGQVTDFTALTIVEKHIPPQATPVMASPVPGETRVLYWQLDGHRFTTQPPAVPARYDVRHLQRFTLGTTYPTIVRTVMDLLVPLGHAVALVIDGTGVGRPVVDLFREQKRRPFRMIPVLITAGDTDSQVDDWRRVPKRDLIGGAVAILQSGRLRIGQFPETSTLITELQNYRVKVTAAANETFNAREGQHDDLVLALALAVWQGEQPGPPRRVPSVGWYTPI